MTSEKRPTPEAPILLVKYTLNMTVNSLMVTDVAVNINPFIINCLTSFKFIYRTDTELIFILFKLLYCKAIDFMIKSKIYSTSVLYPTERSIR